MRFPILLALTAATAFAQGGPLDNRLLLKTPAETWGSYHGDSTGRHYSALNQITRDNVHELSLAWVSRVSTANQGAIFGGDGADPEPTPPGASAPPVRAIPLVVNGVIYYSASGNAFALDAHTGKRLWHFAYRTGGGGTVASPCITTGCS